MLPTKPATKREPGASYTSAGRGHLHDLALVENGDAVGHGHGLLLIVGDDHEGEAKFLLKIHELELRLLAQLLVERAERFVEQKNLGPLGNRTGQRDALSLAAGKLMRLALGELRELHQPEHLGDTLLDLGFGHAFLLEAEGDVLLDRHMRKKRVGLEHHVDRTAVGRNAAQILPVQQYAPRSRLVEAGQHAQQRGFTAARGAEKCKEFALVDGEGKIVDSGEIAEPLGHVLEYYVGLRAGIGPRRETPANAAQ